MAETMPLAMALAALEALHRVCVGMDLENQQERPTEEEYQATMAHAGAVLAAAQSHPAPLEDTHV